MFLLFLATDQLFCLSQKKNKKKTTGRLGIKTVACVTVRACACACVSARNLETNYPKPSIARGKSRKKERQLFQTRNVFQTVTKSDESLTIARLEAPRPHAAIHPAIGWCCPVLLSLSRRHYKAPQTLPLCTATLGLNLSSPLPLSPPKKFSSGVFTPSSLNLGRTLVHFGDCGGEGKEENMRKVALLTRSFPQYKEQRWLEPLVSHPHQLL